MVFHWLAVVTLGAYLAFMFVTWIGNTLGIIEQRLIGLDELDLVPKVQLIHACFGMVVALLILITFIFAPVWWLLKAAMLIVYLLKHIRLKGIGLPAPWGKIAGWTGFFVELAYLVFLVLI